MHLKVFLKLKNLKTLSSGKIYKKNHKNQKTKKNKKKQLGLFFFKNPGFFPTLLQGGGVPSGAVGAGAGSAHLDQQQAGTEGGGGRPAGVGPEEPAGGPEGA